MGVREGDLFTADWARAREAKGDLLPKILPSVALLPSLSLSVSVCLSLPHHLPLSPRRSRGWNPGRQTRVDQTSALTMQTVGTPTLCSPPSPPKTSFCRCDLHQVVCLPPPACFLFPQRCLCGVCVTDWCGAGVCCEWRPTLNPKELSSWLSS